MHKTPIAFILPLISAAALAATTASTTGTTSPPTPTLKVVPLAPASGSGRTQGCVLLRYDVSASGVPENIRILGSAPDHVLDRAAVAVLGRWRYAPAMRDGRPVEAHGLIRMLMFRAPDSKKVPPYPLCSNDRAKGAAGAPPSMPKRVNLDVTRPLVTQTYTAPYDNHVGTLSGKVTMRFCVDTHGRTTNVRVVHSVHGEMFDAAALSYMRASLFKPHMLDGFPVTACGITQTIAFRPAKR